MSKLAVIGCDVGNDTVKLKTRNKSYHVETLVKKPIEARKIFGRGDFGDPISYLDVDIESEGIDGNYYVGNLASKGDDSQESIGGFKSENKLLKVAALTSMAYVLNMENPDENEFTLALGTGLPVREFFYKNTTGQYDFQKVNEYIKQLTGSHKIKFNSSLLGKRQIKINIEDEHLTVLPECYAGLLTIVNDQFGNIRPEFKKPNVNVVSGDLGGGSCDFAGFNNGDYIEQCMFGFDIGINEAQDKICELIKAKANLNSFTRYELNKYIFDKELNGKIETNRGTFDLNQEKMQFYTPLAEKIVYNFRKNLHSNKFDESMIHYFYLFGGGSSEIGNTIIEQLKKEIKKIEIVHDPINRNVEAYYNTVKEYEV